MRLCKQTSDKTQMLQTRLVKTYRVVRNLRNTVCVSHMYYFIYVLSTKARIGWQSLEEVRECKKESLGVV